MTMRSFEFRKEQQEIYMMYSNSKIGSKMKSTVMMTCFRDSTLNSDAVTGQHASPQCRMRCLINHRRA
jgi:hypothetical protein